MLACWHAAPLMLLLSQLLVIIAKVSLEVIETYTIYHVSSASLILFMRFGTWEVISGLRFRLCSAVWRIYPVIHLGYGVVMHGTWSNHLVLNLFDWLLRSFFSISEPLLNSRAVTEVVCLVCPRIRVLQQKFLVSERTAHQCAAVCFQLRLFHVTSADILWKRSHIRGRSVPIQRPQIVKEIVDWSSEVFFLYLALWVDRPFVFLVK